MATMSQRALCDEVVDRSSASSVAADARDSNAPKCVLHDGAVSAKRHIDKKLIIPVFEGTAALRQPCCFDESCECGGNRHSFEKKWLGEDDETAEMAALVPDWFRMEMSNKNENVDLFAHVAYWREGPKAAPVEEEKWWRAYWSEEAVFAAKKRQASSMLMVDPCDSWTQRVQEMCKAAGQDFRCCRTSDSFERGSYEQRRFNVWMWEDFYSNPYMFPTLGCLCNVVRIKQELWNRYGFFFDVDTIQEVYPGNEIASWVAAGYEDFSMGLAEFRDEEMSYEWLNWSFDDRWPKKMRSFDEEMRVLDKREGWRRMKSVFAPCGVMYYTSRDQRIYRGEELPRCLLFDDTRIKNQNAYYWKRRRNIMKEQYDIKEPDWAKFDEICRDKEILVL